MLNKYYVLAEYDYTNPYNDYTNPFNDYTNPYNDYTNPSQDMSNAFAHSTLSCIIDDGV